MTKPTKEDVVIEEIVQELSSYRGIRQALCDIDDADFENDIIPALKKILISRYGDGGPKIIKNELIKFMNKLLDIWSFYGGEKAEEMMIEYLKSKGLTVEEE
jgi:hypothetical protein